MLMLKKHTLAYFCSSKSWGGLEMNQLRNAKWMSERGHEVCILAQKNSKIDYEAKALGIHVEYILPHKKYLDVFAAFRLAQKIKNLNVTHLIVRDPKDMSVCGLAKRLSFRKFALAYFMEMQIGIPKRDFVHTMRYSAFDCWVCPLPWLQKQVLEMTRYPKEKTHIIPSGIELDKFFEAIPSDQAKATLDLDVNKKYIGLAGRYDPQKGQMLLLEAFNKIKNEVDYNVVFLGEPTHGEYADYIDWLKEFVRANSLQGRVHFRSFRDDVETFYAAIDVFVMGTKAETFGMVTIEAMASGCKIVGSNKGGTVEILDYGRLGELYESGNGADLADKLMRAIQNQNFDSEYLKNEVRKYDANRVSEQVESLFQYL